MEHGSIGILFVCLGNICRSPLAEGVFRHHVEAAGLARAFEIVDRTSRALLQHLRREHGL